MIAGENNAILRAQVMYCTVLLLTERNETRGEFCTWTLVNGEENIEENVKPAARWG